MKPTLTTVRGWARSAVGYPARAGAASAPPNARSARERGSCIGDLLRTCCTKQAAGPGLAAVDLALAPLVRRAHRAVHRRVSRAPLDLDETAVAGHRVAAATQRKRPRVVATVKGGKLSFESLRVGHVDPSLRRSSSAKLRRSVART